MTGINRDQRGYMLKMNKSFLVESIRENGWSLSKERQHIGEWNDSVLWTVLKGDRRHDLFRVHKGDKANWDEAFWHFQDFLTRDAKETA